ncbi:MAG: type II toxin-antitoxin system PrlF family antitoxin [Parachlamydiales bacterium]|nr:type II toxin-antitoxin system PrlF family antitoxin [Verrucomicrobiota bacterium]MBX3718673.1 type II toxin-antitoxin system PrlF family antitoxin [Candidatus Acheromyda pituitae]
MAVKTKKRRIIRTSKLTSKYQATVPSEVRRHLRLKKGDQVAYELLSDGTVVLRKTTPIDLQYLNSIEALLSEWESEDDEQAYKDL